MKDLPQEVPLIVKLPELTAALADLIYTPEALVVPLAALPVIIRLPVPVDETFAELKNETPRERSPKRRRIRPEW